MSNSSFGCSQRFVVLRTKGEAAEPITWTSQAAEPITSTSEAAEPITWTSQAAKPSV